MNYNYPYNLFNPSLFEQQRAMQQAQMQFDQEQRKAIDDAVKATNDLIDALSKVATSYQESAVASTFATLLIRMGLDAI